MQIAEATESAEVRDDVLNPLTVWVRRIVTRAAFVVPKRVAAPIPVKRRAAPETKLANKTGNVPSPSYVKVVAIVLATESVRGGEDVATAA